MPYLITTTNERPSGTEFVSRRAVATLDEARAYAAEQIVQRSYRADDFADKRWGNLEQAAFDIGTAIGAIGPLPDGTVIEVQRVEYVKLRSLTTYKVPVYQTPLGPKVEAAILETYNAAQGEKTR